MSIIERAKEWLKIMTDGGYCETSDWNRVIDGLIKELEKANKALKAAKEFNEIDYRYTDPEKFAEIKDKLSEALSEV